MSRDQTGQQSASRPSWLDGGIEALEMVKEDEACAASSVSVVQPVHLADALVKCVASLDQLLSHLAKVPADIGLLNDALISARAALATFEVGK